MPKVFDSEDPNLPNLPDTDVPWSDYDALEDSSMQSIHSFDENKNDNMQENPISHFKRKGSLFSKFSKKSHFDAQFENNNNNNDNANDETGYEEDSEDLELGHGSNFVKFTNSKIHTDLDSNDPLNINLDYPVAPSGILNNQNDIEHSGEPETPMPHQKEEKSTDPTVKRRKRRKNRKARKYKGSGIKKDRVGWEPGVNIETTNVALSTPGSLITIIDYSETRYRVSRFNLYSEMNPKYNRYMSSDSSIIPHDLFSDNESTFYPDVVDDENEHLDSDFKEFNAYMNKVADSRLEIQSAIQNRPSWSKVRWINVTGLSWEAISILGKFYNLHPLAIEDMIDIPQRTKMDIYPTHLFVVLPLLKLLKIKHNDEKKCKSDNGNYGKSGNGNGSGNGYGYGYGYEKMNLNPQFAATTAKTISTKHGLANELSSSSSSIKNVGNVASDSDMLADSITNNTPGRNLNDSLYSANLNSHDRKKLQMINNLRPLTPKSLVVGVEQLSMYLTSDDTVVTFFENYSPEIEKAILSRLSTEYTILRSSCEPSILFHSIVDACVDLLYPVISAYMRVLNEKELDILTSYLPDVQHTQELHLMLNELSLLKSTLLPISSLVSQLQIQAADQSSKFVSESCKIYLADISDHLLSFIDEIEAMSATIENLIDLIFNTISVSTNNSMQQLSIVTVIFLPLSFWTGYYGMNFEIFGNLQSSVSLYWEIAIPFSTGLMMLVMHKSIFRIIISIWKAIKRLAVGIANQSAQIRLRNETNKLRDEARAEKLRWQKFREVQIRRRRRTREK